MADHILDKGYVATAAIGQFRIVTQASATTCTQAAAATGALLGVCQETISADDATNGRVANIRIQGRSRAVNGVAGALAVGTRVTSDASGRCIAATTGNVVVGVVRVAGAAQGDHIEIDLTPGVVA